MKPLHARIALVLLTLLAYSNSFDGALLLDAKGLILNDPRIREASAENLGLIASHSYWWPNGESGLYRPFTTFTYLLNYSAGGAAPAGYHWFNFLLHVVNVLVVFALARRFLAGRFLAGFGPAFFAAGIWAVHPLNTECVTNVAGRPDLLAAAAVLGGFLAYLRAAEASGTRKAIWIGVLAVVATAGVFSKESAVVLPGLILLYELAIGRRARWEIAATVVPALAMLWARHSVLSAALPMEIPFTDNPIVGADFVSGRFTALTVLGRYLALMLWPARLCADYSWPQIPIASGAPMEWIAALASLAVIPFALWLWRNGKACFVFVGLGLMWLAPSANLLFPIGTIMAERFLYLPVLGASFCVAAGVADRRYAPVALGLVTAALAARTWVRNADWRDDMSIARATAESSPLSYKAHALLATVLYESHGDKARVLEESVKSREPLDKLPDDRVPPAPYRFAATLYMEGGDYPKAIAALSRYIAADRAELAAFKAAVPGGVSTEEIERAARSRETEAESLLAEASRLAGKSAPRVVDPLSPETYRQQAAAAASSGRLDEAAVDLVEGAFVTSDASLREALVQLYKEGLDPKSCALSAGPAGPAINPDCPIVHRHVCAAAPFVLKTLAADHRAELAQTRKKMFAAQFGCPRAPLDEALP